MDMQMVVRKLFAKAASTHSEHEAEAAILKAQELMAKYGIQDAGEENDIKYITLTCKHTGNRSFRRPLAKIIADNFRVKNYLRDMQVTFFGRENDVLIAKEAFEYTYSNHQNCRHPSGRQLSQLPLSQKLESHQGFLRFWGFGS